MQVGLIRVFGEGNTEVFEACEVWIYQLCTLDYKEINSSSQCCVDLESPNVLTGRILFYQYELFWVQF